MSAGSADRSLLIASDPEVIHIKTVEINTISALFKVILIGKLVAFIAKSYKPKEKANHGI